MGPVASKSGQARNNGLSLLGNWANSFSPHLGNRGESECNKLALISPFANTSACVTTVRRGLDD